MMNLRPLLPVLGAALAFSSCTYCNIGGYIGNSFTTYTGVDVDHPVDGKVYRVGDGKAPAYYMLAPEITFSPCPDMIAREGIKDSRHWNDCYPRHVRQTGRQRWVRVSPRYDALTVDRHGREHAQAYWNCSWRYCGDVAQLPAQAVLYREGVSIPTRDESGSYGGVEQEDRSDSLGARLLSAPFNYAIDPLVTVCATTVELTAEVLLMPAGFTYIMVDSCNSSRRRQLSGQEQETLLRCNIIEAEVSQFDNASFISYNPCRYTMEPGTKQLARVEKDKVRGKDTTVEELPYFVDKNKPCVLVLKSKSLGFAPSRKLRENLAKQLESQGLRLQGFIISHHPTMDNYSYLPYKP